MSRCCWCVWRGEVKAERGHPAKEACKKTRVVHANLSRLPEDLVEEIEGRCRGGGRKAGGADAGAGAGEMEVSMGPCYGVLAGLHGLAQQTGWVETLGPERMAKLAWFLIYARVAGQGGRLGALRWAEDRTVSEVLGLDEIDE